MSSNVETMVEEAISEGMRGHYVRASEIWDSLISLTKNDPEYDLEREYFLEERNDCLCKARVEMDSQ